MYGTRKTSATGQPAVLLGGTKITILLCIKLLKGLFDPSEMRNLLKEGFHNVQTRCCTLVAASTQESNWEG